MYLFQSILTGVLLISAVMAITHVPKNINIFN